MIPLVSGVLAVAVVVVVHVALPTSRRRSLSLAAGVGGGVLLGGGVVAVGGAGAAGIGALVGATVAAVAAVIVSGLPTSRPRFPRLGAALSTLDGPAADRPEPGAGYVASVLGETIAREVMVPRTDMVAVPVDAAIGVLGELVAVHGFSRYPVIGSGLDDIAGVVIAKDLLIPRTPAPRRVGDVLRPVDFVPETMRLPELLELMQGSGHHMVVIVDEYGGTAGLVTIEDLLEELVGDILDEFDDGERPLAVAQGEGVWRIDGRFPVWDLARLVGADLPGEWDSVGGLVLGLAGRVPAVGESFSVGGVQLTVTRVKGRRVVELAVTAPSGVDAPAETA